jgi:hypothetical protein
VSRPWGAYVAVLNSIPAALLNAVEVMYSLRGFAWMVINNVTARPITKGSLFIESLLSLDVMGWCGIFHPARLIYTE